MTIWTGTSRSNGIAWLGVLVFILLGALTIALWSTSPIWVKIMNIVLALGIPASLVIASSLRIDVTTEAFTVAWGPTHWPVRTIGWSDVTAVSVVEISPWQWGGWGYRWNPAKKGSAAVVRGGPGIQLDLRNGRQFLVTVDDAVSGAAAAGAAHLHYTSDD